MAKKLDLREAMPVTAAIIAEFRIAFGVGNINDVVRRGMAGEPVFYAEENGYKVGTPVPQGVRVGFNSAGNRYLLDGPQPGDDWGQPTRRRQWAKK